MARLPYPDASELSAPLAAEMATLPQMNVLRMLSHAGEVFPSWRAFSGALLNDTAISPVLRELAILRVASLSPGADYEREQHEVIAREVGVTEAQVAGALTGSGLSGDAELVVRFTEEVVQNVSPSEGTWADVAARFPPREIMELLLVIGQYMAVARIIATTGVESDEAIGTALFDALR